VECIAPRDRLLTGIAVLSVTGRAPRMRRRPLAVQFAYLFAAGWKVRSASGRQADVDVTFDDIWDHLDIAFMGIARRARDVGSARPLVQRVEAEASRSWQRARQDRRATGTLESPPPCGSISSAAYRIGERIPIDLIGSALHPDRQRPGSHRDHRWTFRAGRAAKQRRAGGDQ
jgi:hypothetical protein